MKRRLLCAVMAFCIVLTLAPVASAKETSVGKTYLINTLILDDSSVHEMHYMVSSDNSVYIMAEDLAWIMALSDEYSYEQSYETCAFVHSVSNYTVMFEFGSRNVSVFYCGYLVEYTAPAVALYTDDVCWLPLHFAISMFGGEVMPGLDAIAVDMPRETALSTITYAYNQRNKLRFSWTEDVGYSQATLNKLTSCAKVVTFLDDLLSFELSAWGTLLGGDDVTGASSTKYAEQIAPLFIGSTAEELSGDNSILRFSDVADVTEAILEECHSLNDMGEGYEWLAEGDATDFMDGVLEMKCFKDSKKLKKLRENVKKMRDNVDDFADVMGKQETILDKVEDLDETKPVEALETITTIVQFLDYCSRFYKKNEFAVNALKTYAADAKENGATYFKVFASNQQDAFRGTTVQFLIDNFDSFVSDELNLELLLGAPAAGILWVWDLVSEKFLNKYFESIETFQLVNYCQRYQNEANKIAGTYVAKTFANEKINENYIDELSGNTYAFLKFSAICHNSAASFIQMNDKLEKNKQEAILKGLDAKQTQVIYLINAIEAGEETLLPSECRKGMFKTEDKKIKDFLEANATLLDTVVQEQEPILDTTGAISPEEACELCRNVYEGPIFAIVGGPQVKILGEYWDQFTYEVIDTKYYEEGKTGVYVIMENGDSEYYYYVPFDGKAVWFAFPGPDEDFVYSSCNLLEFSITDIPQLLGEMGADVIDLTKKLVELQAGMSQVESAG